MPHSRFFRLALFMLVCSGASSLIYEVAWFRLLSLSFGVSVYAASALLTAFMAGLALGSRIFGGYVERIALQPDADTKLLRLYAGLQAAVGVYALLTQPIFDALTAVYVALSQSVPQDGGTPLHLLRFALAMAGLLLPTMLMGGTLPALSQVLARSERRRGEDLGLLYAVNTFGGVLGALLAGILLIRLLGVQTTIVIAALLDLLVAGAAFWASRRTLIDDIGDDRVDRAELRREQRARKRLQEPATPQPAAIAALPDIPPARAAILVLWLFAISGFVSLSYQVVWTRVLAIFSLNAIFSFTIIVATFLTGLALGSAIGTRFADRSRQPLRLFGMLQLAIGVCGVLVLYMFARLPTIHETLPLTDTLTNVILVEFMVAALTMLLPTILIGMNFPVAARIFSAGAVAVGRKVGDLYALNTIAAAIGAFVAGFVLIPMLGMQHAELLLAAINLLVGAVALLVLPRPPLPYLGGAVAVALVGAALLPPGVYLGFREGVTENLVFYREGIDATVSVFEVKSPPLKISFVNGRNEVPTDAQSMRAFYLLGHLPPLLKPDARNALMISFGNGIATGAMSTHNIPEIRTVELVAEQYEAAARFYTAENWNVMQYPGLRPIVEDGRNYLLRSRETYDIITADATHPINSSSWALFTREFYGMIRQRLAPDGVFIQWLPFHDLAEQDYHAIIATFQSVFPNTTLFYTGAIHTFLVATPEPLTREHILALDVQLQQHVALQDLGDGPRLARDFLMDSAQVHEYVGDVPIVTDDRAFFLPAMDRGRIEQSLLNYARQAAP